MSDTNTVYVSLFKWRTCQQLAFCTHFYLQSHHNFALLLENLSLRLEWDHFCDYARKFETHLVGQRLLRWKQHWYRSLHRAVRFRNEEQFRSPSGESKILNLDIEQLLTLQDFEQISRIFFQLGNGTSFL